MAPILRFRRSRRGTAAVEFAVLLPFLMFLFVIAVDYCRIFYYTVTIENCAYNGALFGSQSINSSQWENNGNLITSVQDAAVADGAKLNPALAASNVGVTNGKDADGNSIVQVKITYAFNTITKYPGIPSPVSLVRTVQMRVAPP